MGAFFMSRMDHKAMPAGGLPRVRALELARGGVACGPYETLKPAHNINHLHGRKLHGG